MLNKTDLKIFVGSLMLVALLAATYVAIDGGFDKVDFVDIKKLQENFPPGSDHKLLEGKLLAWGYAKYPCPKQKAVLPADEIACFKKRRCSEPSGWDAHAISVANDKRGRILFIDALGATSVFDQTCAQADKFVAHQSLENGRLSEIPWKTSEDSREQLQNQKKYFQDQLNIFQEKFPAGSDIASLISSAKNAGYFIQGYSCLKNHTNNAIGKARCLSIYKVYGTRSAVWQAYDVFYDDARKIISIEMGISTSWKD